jgi:hypothetical protein
MASLEPRRTRRRSRSRSQSRSRSRSRSINRNAPIGNLSLRQIEHRIAHLRRRSEELNDKHSEAEDRLRAYRRAHVGQSSKAVKDMRKKLEEASDRAFGRYAANGREERRLIQEYNRRNGYMEANAPDSDEEDEGIIPPAPPAGAAEAHPIPPVPAGFVPVPIPVPDAARCTGTNAMTMEPLVPATSVLLSDGQCYSHEGIVGLYNSAATSRQGFRSPLTRKPFTRHDIDMVLTLKQRMNGGKRRTRRR